MSCVSVSSDSSFFEFLVHPKTKNAENVQKNIDAKRMCLFFIIPKYHKNIISSTT